MKCTYVWSYFQLHVLAIDKGFPSKQNEVTVTVIIKRNTQPLSFIRNSYKAIVNESIPVGSSVIQMAAQDMDGVNIIFSPFFVQAANISLLYTFMFFKPHLSSL